MILLVALHKYLINIKIVYISLFTSNETVFPKMKCFGTKKLFYGGDEHLWVHLVGNLIKIKMKTTKKIHTKSLEYRCDLILYISSYNSMKCVLAIVFNTPFMGKDCFIHYT